MSFYNHKRKSKAEIEAARQLIRKVIAGEPIPAKVKALGVWIQEGEDQFRGPEDQIVTRAEYEALSTDGTVSMVVLYTPDPGCLPIGTNPDEHIMKHAPVKAQEDAEEAEIKKLYEPKPWWKWGKSGKAEPIPEEKPKPKPIRIFNPDDMTSWEEHRALNEQFSRTFNTSNYGI